MRFRISWIWLLCAAILIPGRAASAAAPSSVSQDRVAFDFPISATFSATLTSEAVITSAVLEYGNERQTCGEVIAKAFPRFTPAASVDVEWTWDMRQSGSLPPGATIWWRWRFTDETGRETLGERQTVTWLDDRHDWQTLSASGLNLHYYGKDPAFAQTMLEAGIEGLRRNREQAGLTAEGTVDIYLYPNYTDMQEAVLYEPSWTGGMAYSDFNIIIMGLSDFDEDWNQNTVIHELTHVLVGSFTFSCIGTLPGWIEEGLAMYSEGGLDAGMQSLLDAAIRDDNLITLRSLNGGFSELPDKANLSYSQSYSVVKFLIETHGQERMTALLLALRDGKPIDTALVETYGFDTDGLDDAWRESVGAAPRPAAAQPTAQPSPTQVPTFVPVAGIPLAVTPTPYAIPTSSFSEGTDFVASNMPPLFLTVAVVCSCGLVLLVIGVFILGLVLRRRNAQPHGGGGND